MLSPDNGNILTLSYQHRGIVRGTNGTGRTEMISGRTLDICEPCFALWDSFRTMVGLRNIQVDTCVGLCMEDLPAG